MGADCSTVEEVKPHTVNILGKKIGDYCSIVESVKMQRARIELEDSLQELAQNTVEVLDLTGIGRGDEGAILIATALKKNTSVRELCLRWSSIGIDGAVAVAASLHDGNRSLTGLDLFCNSIKDAGAAAVSVAIIANPAIRTLDLGWNSIGDSGAAAIAKALKAGCFVSKLGLEQNAIGENGGYALASALCRNTSLTELRLAGNPVGEVAAVKLGESAAFCPRLTSFDLFPESEGTVFCPSSRSMFSLSSVSVPDDEELRAEFDLAANAL